MLKLLLLAALAADPPAVPALDTALARMGGAEALERVERVRYDMITQWQRTAFDARPYADQPSYEQHTDWRDYGLGAWRNTRKFLGAGGGREITDVVRDSVAIRRMNGAWAPLSVAYVDERRELFTFAPERVLLLAKRAADLKGLPDTAIAGVAHARVSATIEGFPATLFLRRTDGLPAMVRWRAAQPNDFGLVPWGEMEAEVWYSGWRRTSAGVVLPTQLDVRRVGRPYKRVTILSAVFDGVVADSFAVSDSLRQAFFATANRPMHDLPLDSAKVVDGRFAVFGAFGTPPGAVKLGRRWVLLETGQAPLSIERSAAWLTGQAGGGALAGAVVTMPAAGQGGAAWLAGRRVPLHVAPGARPFVATILKNNGRSAAAMTPVAVRGQWLKVDGDSLWVEPIDLPDAPGAALVYVPSLRWAYSALAASPLHLDYVLARLRERGMPVERIGSARGLVAPLPPAGTAPQR